jgi:TonB-dependent Receptor Plug Domain/CarboxypepD_reg-like domain
MTANIAVRIKKAAPLLFSLFSCASVFSQKTATLKGNIYDGISKDGLAGAYVSINKTSFKKVADDKGNFEISGIPPGEYDISIENIGYTVVTRHVELKAGETFKMFTSLSPNGKTLGEVTVFGQKNREIETGSRNYEKNAANITNAISSQAMIRSPDINAANVLQRMSGVTLQRSTGGDEAYAVIRGMEPRYNNTLLNGVKIASPDSKNRYVQLNIIPSDILTSIEISKSLLPDMEGDATGGTVNMVVKDAPDKGSFKATAGIGYSQLFFDEKFIGFNTSDIQQKSPIQRNPPGYIAQPGDFSRSNLDFEPQQFVPTVLAGFSYTQRFLKDKLGFVLADNIQNQYYGNISFTATVTPGADTTGRLEANDANNFKEYTRQLNNGLVAHLDYVINERNKVNIDNFFLYSYLSQARLNVDTTLIGTGRTGPGTGQIFLTDQSQTQHEYVECLKLSGQHFLSSAFRLDWSGVYSNAGNKQPDVATISNVFLINSDFTQTPVYFNGITREWLKNDDQGYSGLLNLDYHKKWKAGDLEAKIGGLYRYMSRYNTEDDYNLVPPTTNSSGGAASKPLWTNIYDVQWVVFNTAGTGYNPNNYHATELIFAEYAMLRYRTEKWEAGGGLRVENTNDNWDIKVHSATAPSFGGQIYQDFLPSFFAKIKFTNREYLHFSYYRSIARPNYYELVPAETSSPSSNIIVNGNPFVIHSVADNFDIRYELFPKGEQQLFLGVFYKHIQDPIELRISADGAAAGRFYEQPLNSNPATNLGGEISFTQYWGHFGITGNYTYTHSAISSDQLTYQGKIVSPTRPMEGQTNNICNLSLLYKDSPHGIFAQLAYEFQGRTLAATSTYAGSDYIQQSMSTLAFSAEKDIHKHFTVFGKFNNLLNTPVKQYVQNTILVVQNIYKATYNIGIRYAR